MQGPQSGQRHQQGPPISQRMGRLTLLKPRLRTVAAVYFGARQWKRSHAHCVHSVSHRGWELVTGEMLRNEDLDKPGGNRMISRRPYLVIACLTISSDPCASPPQPCRRAFLPMLVPLFPPPSPPPLSPCPSRPKPRPRFLSPTPISWDCPRYSSLPKTLRP